MPDLKINERLQVAQLRRDLASAKLPCKIVDTASKFSGRIAADTAAFLMDIRRGKGRKNENTEHFVIFPGRGTDLKIVSVDAKLRQAVLWVQEPEGKLEVTRTYIDGATRKRMEEKVIQDVPAAQRYFLVGCDELHLFMCQLKSAAASVKQAHEILKPPTAKSKDFKRQGEWFFTPLSDSELNSLERAVAENLKARDQAIKAAAKPMADEAAMRATNEIRKEAVLKRTTEKPVARYWGPRPEPEVKEGIPAPLIRTKQRLGSRLGANQQRGRAHVAEYVIHLGGKEYAKGDITHPQHKTKRLASWYRVEKNEERPQALPNVQWID